MTEEKDLLKFGKGNAKLSKEIYHFSIPSGYTCPGAKDCKSYAHPDTGHIKDGVHTEFRCFSAAAESAYLATRAQRWYNRKLLAKCRSSQEIYELIKASLPEQAKYVRVHIAGDFYGMDYFDAWMRVARENPKRLFYAYTKSLHLWVKRVDEIPANFYLTASRGGKFDHLIEEYDLPNATVVYHPEDAEEKGMLIDHDDSLAMSANRGSFALLLHGTQPAGSEAASALQRLRKEGVKHGYSSKKKQPELT